jgi:hypothetical protein
MTLLVDFGCFFGKTFLLSDIVFEIISFRPLDLLILDLC